MMTLRDITLRLRALLRPRQVEADLDDELAFHLEREERKLIDAGMPPAEARIQARARFGSVALAADECRDARGTAFVDTTVRDVGYALRSFRRSPLSPSSSPLALASGSWRWCLPSTAPSICLATPSVTRTLSS